MHCKGFPIERRSVRTPALFMSAWWGVQQGLISLFILGCRGRKWWFEPPAQPLCLPADHPPERRPKPGYQRSLRWATPFICFLLRVAPLCFLSLTWVLLHFAPSASFLISDATSCWLLSRSEHSTPGFVHLIYTGEGAALCLLPDCAAAKPLPCCN